MYNKVEDKPKKLLPPTSLAIVTDGYQEGVWWSLLNDAICMSPDPVAIPEYPGNPHKKEHKLFPPRSL